MSTRVRLTSASAAAVLCGLLLTACSSSGSGDGATSPAPSTSISSSAPADAESSTPAASDADFTYGVTAAEIADKISCTNLETDPNPLDAGETESMICDAPDGTPAAIVTFADADTQHAASAFVDSAATDEAREIAIAEGDGWWVSVNYDKAGDVAAEDVAADLSELIPVIGGEVVTLGSAS